MQEIFSGVTSVNTFSSCRKRWWYERYWYSPKSSGPMYLGQLVHSYMEAFYQEIKSGADREHAHVAALQYMSDVPNGKYADTAKLLIEEKGWDVVQELEDTAEGMCQNYYNTGVTIPAGRIVGVEEEVQFTDEASGVTIRGIIDLLIETPNGNLVVVDHKTRGRRMTAIETALSFDTQLILYALMAENQFAKFGQKVVSIVHNILYTRVPEYPNVLKSGELSRAKSTLEKTTYGMYKAAIQSNKQNPAEYEAELRFLRERDAIYSPFFDQVKVPVHDQVLLSVLKELRVKMLEMRKVMENPEAFAYRSNNLYNCNFCPFVDVCFADMMGVNAETVLQQFFVPNTNTFNTNEESENE